MTTAFKVFRRHDDEIEGNPSVSEGSIDFDCLLAFRAFHRHDNQQIDIAVRTVSLDLLVVIPEDFERGRAEIGSVLRPAALEGQVLYDRAA